MSYLPGKPFVPSAAVAEEGKGTLDRNAPEFRPVKPKDADAEAAKFRIDAPVFRPTPADTQGVSFHPDAHAFQPSMPLPSASEYGGPTHFTGGSDFYGEKDDSFTHMTIPGPEVRLRPARRTWKSLFVGESMYSFFREDTVSRLAQVASSDPRYKEIPPQYTSMFPLDKHATTGTTGSLGYITSLYKVVDSRDGHVYTLRRCDKVSIPPRTIEGILSAWTGEIHPSIVPLRSIFLYQRALFFVHDFVPSARSVADLFLRSRGALVPEPLLWRVLCQVSVGLRTLHSRRLSFRGLRPESILLVGKRRVLVSNSGVVAALEHQTEMDFDTAQRHDIHSLGLIVLSIACRTPMAQKNVDASLDFVRKNYSVDLAKLLHLVLAEPISVYDLVQALAPYMATELDSKLEESFALESALSQEVENGRLMRLLIKMGFINERPEHLGDPMWSETGERYLLKLFRDYVFHQVDDDGKPILDVAHVIESLNKLDVGDPQSIVLSSRDKEDVLIPTFSEIRRCVNQAFSDLRKTRTTRDTSLQHKRHSRAAQRVAMSTPASGPGYANFVLSKGDSGGGGGPSAPFMQHSGSMGMEAPSMRGAPTTAGGFPMFTPSVNIQPAHEVGAPQRSRLSLPPGGQIAEFVPGQYAGQ